LIDPKEGNPFPLDAFDQPRPWRRRIKVPGAHIIIRIFATVGPFRVVGKVINGFQEGYALELYFINPFRIREAVIAEPSETFLCGSAPVITREFSERALEPARPLAEIKILIGMEAEHLDGGKGKPDENHRKKEGAESRRLFP
jgi:hypothetical protein